jgi:hypothetical protein
MIPSSGFGSVDSAPWPLLRPRVRGPLRPVYRVGELFRRGHREWPRGAEFAFGPGGHELTLFRPAIGPELAEAVGRGPAEFALIVRWPILVLTYRFGEAIPWEDTPYCWHLQPEARRVVPDAAIAPGARTLLWISLVGADDGIIHAQRGMTLSPEFTRALHDAIRDQALSPFDQDACTAAVARVYVRHHETADRLPIAAARTMGNA